MELGSTEWGCLAVALCAAALSLNAAKAPPETSPPARPAAPKMLPAQEYGFRGMRLGTALADFRKAPFPDAGTPASVICSGEPDAANVAGGFEAGAIEKAAGVVVCGYFVKSPAAPGSWQSMGVNVGATGRLTTDLAYSFVPDPADGVPKLYLIRAVTAADSTKPAITDLTAEYGPPSSRTERAIAPPLGKPYTAILANWLNPMSQIAVQTPFYGQANLGILYTERRLADIVALAKVPRGSR